MTERHVWFDNVQYRDTNKRDLYVGWEGRERVLVRVAQHNKDQTEVSHIDLKLSRIDTWKLVNFLVRTLAEE